MSCRGHGGHEVDVVALDRGSLPRRKNASIAVLGEAKHTGKPRGSADLERLEHIAAVLAERGWDTGGTAYALFSHSGFTDELKAAAAGGRVTLVDLPELYGRALEALVISGGHSG